MRKPYRGPGGNGYRGQKPLTPYSSPRPLPRPQMREPDPKTLARDFFEDRGSEYAGNTAGIEAEAREPYVELVESQAFEIAIRTVFVPVIKKLRLALIHRFDLPDDGRQRNIGFLYFFHMVLDELYKRANMEMPDELKREFN